MRRSETLLLYKLQVSLEVAQLLALVFNVKFQMVHKSHHIVDFFVLLLNRPLQLGDVLVLLNDYLSQHLVYELVVILEYQELIFIPCLVQFDVINRCFWALFYWNHLVI